MVPVSELESHAQDAASLRHELANPRQLMLPCQLAAEGEVTVGHLAERVGLSQAALSQHLMRLRGEGLAARRREGTHLHYRIADPRVGRLMQALHGVFCEPQSISLSHRSRRRPRHDPSHHHPCPRRGPAEVRGRHPRGCARGG